MAGSKGAKRGKEKGSKGSQRVVGSKVGKGWLGESISNAEITLELKTTFAATMGAAARCPFGYFSAHEN